MDYNTGFAPNVYGGIARPGVYPPAMPQYPQYQAQPQSMAQNIPQQQMPIANSLAGRVVTSKEEALGVPVDFMGTPMFFPDLAHGVVYMKKFNTNTGAADIFEFRVAPTEPPKETPAITYVPMSDFEAMSKKVESLEEELKNLNTTKRTTSQKGAVKDD